MKGDPFQNIPKKGPDYTPWLLALVAVVLVVWVVGDAVGVW